MVRAEHVSTYPEFISIWVLILTSGLGVFSVWMKIVRFAFDGPLTRVVTDWWLGRRVGRWRASEGVMAGIRAER